MWSKWIPVIYYLVLWGGARVRGTVRRWRQPLLRGPEWLFNVRVQPDFYEGPGRKILLHFRMKIFVSYLIEVPLTIVFFVRRDYMALASLIILISVFIHVFHVFNVHSAESQARQFAVPEAEQPVAAMALSLKTRRLRDYTNSRLEIAIAFCTIVAFTLLVRYYFSAPEHHNFRLVFAQPIFWFYASLGILLAKVIIIAWRAPLPQAQMEEHMAVREEARNVYIKVCDRSRAILAVFILGWPFFLSAPGSMLEIIGIITLSVLLVLGIVLGVWQEIRRKRILALALRAQPVKLPDFSGQSEVSGWPLCYQPSIPMIVLKGVRGYSLNLANQFTQLGAAYLVGLVTLCALLPPLY